MKKYSSADREMCSQFKKVQVHPMEKYIGRLAKVNGDKLEVVGYNRHAREGEFFLIVDASQSGGWPNLGPSDITVKECKYYWYVYISDLID